MNFTISTSCLGLGVDSTAEFSIVGNDDNTADSERREPVAKHWLVA